jgi:RNA polymerase sigma-B factor
VERRNTSLVLEYQKSRDTDVLQKIIDDNEGLIHAVLKRFSYFPDPYEDIVQVARLGMIKAVQRFDPSHRAEFSSYATAIIDGEVRHYLRDNVLMRQPRWLRKSEKRIEEASIDLSRKLGRAPTLKELSREVNITEDGILEILRARAAVDLHPVDDPISGDGFTSKLDHSQVSSLRYQSFSLPIEDEITLHEAMRALDSFQKKLVYLLFYKDLTQTEVAGRLGLSQRQVSRESARAMKRLKAVLNTKIF